MTANKSAGTIRKLLTRSLAGVIMVAMYCFNSVVVSGVVSGVVVVVVVEVAGVVVVVAEQSTNAAASLSGSGVDDPTVLVELFDVGVLAALEGVELELVWPSIR